MRNSPQDVFKKILGRTGEKQAEAYYKKQGCRILERNYQTPFGEADLVLQDGEELVFAEVKTRSSDNYGTPAEAVTRQKQRRYRKIAEYYLLRKTEEVPVRFDVVEVRDGAVSLLKNAF